MRLACLCHFWGHSPAYLDGLNQPWPKAFANYAVLAPLVWLMCFKRTSKLRRIAWKRLEVKMSLAQSCMSCFAARRAYLDKTTKRTSQRISSCESTLGTLGHVLCRNQGWYSMLARYVQPAAENSRECTAPRNELKRCNLQSWMHIESSQQSKKQPKEVSHLEPDKRML